MTPEDWQKLKQEMQFKPTMLDVGFPDKSPQSVGGDRDILTTYKPGTERYERFLATLTCATEAIHYDRKQTYETKSTKD